MPDGPALMSPADGHEAPAASRTGADLRAARERLGLSLPDIAGHLRIRLPYLAAIETGRIGELPGNAYAVGFVRTYAKALGLDQDEMARRFRAEAADVNRKTKLTFPAPVPERGVPAGALVLVGAALCIGAYVGWYRISGDRPGPEPVRPVPERLAALSEPAKPEPAPAPPAAPVATANIPPTSAAAAMPQPGLFGPPAPPAAPAAAAPAAATPAAATPAAAAPAAAAPATPPAAPGDSRVTLRARADAWVQVRDPKGSVLLNRVLRAGDTWPVPRGPYLLTTGNAGGTEILLDGQPIALGGDGAVRRDLQLDPETIKDGKLVPLAVPAATPVRPAATAPLPSAPPPPARLNP